LPRANRASIPRGLEAEEIPDFVNDLLGPFHGVRGVVVESGANPCVSLYTGGSAYHFSIRVCPARLNLSKPPWFAGESESFEWRPGVYLGTEGK
jgi:hypothetical protein